MEQKLKKIMSKIFNIPPEEITKESSMDNLEAWDSLGHLSLIITLEEEFDFSLSEEQILQMTSYMEIKRICESIGL